MKRKAKKQQREAAPPKKGTVRYFAEKAILAGKGTVGVIAAVRRSRPEAKISAAGVSYYRHWMRVRGERVPPAGKGLPA